MSLFVHVSESVHVESLSMQLDNVFIYVLGSQDVRKAYTILSVRFYIFFHMCVTVCRSVWG